MIRKIRTFFRRFGKKSGGNGGNGGSEGAGSGKSKDKNMQHQKLTYITRGLQNAAAETNSMVADQYIRILSQYFEHLDDGTLQAKMVRVQLDDSHYANVPLVSLVAPTGLALDRMRVELSIRLEGAENEQTSVLQHVRKVVREKGEEVNRSNFSVSLSPRTNFRGRGRPSDHVHIDLEFKSIQTPESIMRVIDTYTNMITPIRIAPNGGKGPDGSPTPGTEDPNSPAPDGGGTDSAPVESMGETFTGAASGVIFGSMTNSDEAPSEVAEPKPAESAAADDGGDGATSSTDQETAEDDASTAAGDPMESETDDADGASEDAAEIENSAPESSVSDADSEDRPALTDEAPSAEDNVGEEDSAVESDLPAEDEDSATQDDPTDGDNITPSDDGEKNPWRF